MTATHDDQLLAEFQASFQESHDDLEALLATHTKNAILTILSKTMTALLLASDEPMGLKPDSPMIAQLNTLPSIMLNNTELEVWAHSPRFKNGTDVDTITLTYWVEKMHGDVAFEFDAALRLPVDGAEPTVMLVSHLRWADWDV